MSFGGVNQGFWWMFSAGKVVGTCTSPFVRGLRCDVLSVTFIAVDDSSMGTRDLKLTVGTWTYGIRKGKDRLPTIIFLGKLLVSRGEVVMDTGKILKAVFYDYCEYCVDPTSIRMGVDLWHRDVSRLWKDCTLKEKEAIDLMGTLGFHHH